LQLFIVLISVQNGVYLCFLDRKLNQILQLTVL